MAQTTGRAWTVQLEYRGTLVTGHVRADGRMLLPSLRPSNVSSALEYVEGALVDVREGDIISMVVQCETEPVPVQVFDSRSRPIALAWLEELFAQSEKSNGGRDRAVHSRMQGAT